MEIGADAESEGNASDESECPLAEDGVMFEADKPWWHNIVRESTPTYVTAVADGRIVGRLQQLNANSYKATCRAVGHTKCVCWVSLKNCTEESMSNLRDDLLAWLADGTRVSLERHLETARDLKRSKGMRVRS